MLKGFRDFILKGNVVDMAVGVVVGVSFGAIVNALVKDLITPLVGVFGGVPDFSGLVISVNKTNFLVGDFINALISFLTISLVVYLAVVLPMNKLLERVKSGKEKEISEKTCPECLSTIPLKARKCRFCSSILK